MRPSRRNEHELGPELMRVAQEVRARLLLENQPLQLRDVYTLCFQIARELYPQHPDLRIMVGDRVGERGPVQHHWLEFPDSGYFLDPAYDELDPFQPVRAGRTSEEEFSSVYQNGLDSKFDVTDPRDRPEMVYRARTAFDPERGSE